MVTKKDIDATDKTITKNRLNKDLKEFYSIKYTNNLDIEIGGAVLVYEDGSIQYLLARQNTISKKTTHFRSESESAQRILRDKRYLDQCNGNKNEILKSLLVHVCISGSQSNLKDFIDTAI